MKLLFSMLLPAFLAPQAALACATCFGAADSSQTAGMNMAILTLLGVTGAVLGGVVVFFVHLLRRSSMTVDESDAAELDPKEKKEEILT